MGADVVFHDDADEPACFEWLEHIPCAASAMPERSRAEAKEASQTGRFGAITA